MMVAEEGRKGMHRGSDGGPSSRWRVDYRVRGIGGGQLPADGQDGGALRAAIGCDHEARKVPYVKNHLINQHANPSSTSRGKKPPTPGWEGAIQGRESLDCSSGHYTAASTSKPAVAPPVGERSRKQKKFDLRTSPGPLWRLHTRLTGFGTV